MVASAAIAGAAYFAAVFATGFVLGTLRILILAPYLGPVGAVLVELPVILTACWFLCRWSVRRFGVPDGLNARLLMGAVAFGLLLAAEAALSMGGFGRSWAEHLAHYRTVHGAIGLGGQVLFALLPAIQRGRT